MCIPAIRSGNMNFADEKKYAETLVEEEQNLDKDFFRLGYFEGDRLFATLRSEPFWGYFDGNKIRLSGVGGVIADPNAPQKGMIKELFKKGFERMRENGQIVSHLYPFQANYYRQYGYEISCKHHLWKIPVEYISNDFSGKNVYYDESITMQEEIKELHSKFAEQYNLSIIKTEKQWECFFEEIIPYKGDYFSYVHYTEGKADAFMAYKLIEKENDPQDLCVDYLWFASYQGLRGVMSYFVSQRPYADRVWVKAPLNIDFNAFNEFQGGWGKRNTNCEVVSDGTTRVVDVEKVLQLACYHGTGTIGIQIENDIYCPWNNDCFTVSFGQETCVMRGGVPDIILDVNAFGAMILGAVSLEEAQIFQNVSILGNTENLRKVFYKRELYIDEHF